MTKATEALVGASVVVEDAVLDNHAVLVRDGAIEAIVPTDQLPDSMSVRDVGPGFLAPGFVDIHTHGAAGHEFIEGTKEAYSEVLQSYLQAGITTLLPTLSSAPISNIEKSLECLEHFQSGDDYPTIPGAHLEGPYFSYAERGAHNPSMLRSPNDGSIDQLLEHAPAIRMMSLAPELPGAIKLTERLVSSGIIAAAGHSDARDEDLYACQRAGLSHVIHIFSGQSTTVRRGPWRHPGMLEATLASTGLTVEMIADGKHLPPTLMKVAYRCLAGSLCLVSDSGPGAGLPNGTVLRADGRDSIIEDGVAMLQDRTAFAGSATLLSQMIPIAMAALEIDLPQAIAMASSIPARVIGLADVGRIAPHMRADFVLLDRDLKVSGVAVGGKWVRRPDSVAPCILGSRV